MCYFLNGIELLADAITAVHITNDLDHTSDIVKDRGDLNAVRTQTLQARASVANESITRQEDVLLHAGQQVASRAVRPRLLKLEQVRIAIQFLVRQVAKLELSLSEQVEPSVHHSSDNGIATDTISGPRNEVIADALTGHRLVSFRQHHCRLDSAFGFTPQDGID